ncbi:hypothetical protein AGABI1DRAFT_85248 [Agaricus bisporus var. burnettii JB137-S8]|uniref:Mitochondrial ribosomal protein subunit L20-domain-containing protein n=1 Tax=Agaricus bisporus var. burnettii (strain JB137-S8 / ATCC MYA-4627 / FGSC 10392) TaxID=597362 RepID=K5WV91_AGABU|nr:uncharacterized protein AGABI1DRAFT_85248 [Agaricus bisporus var. burnettii JB137-S8]EKM79401.1 hypothetical protein AGABI1DRAFT_85248 [Agaricus bisporus var. burnettii JB137-S8]
MNITRALSSSRLLSRSYATKHASKFPRPKPGAAERPAYHAPDPLVNNPKAAVTTLDDENLTFIHRPPPSAASAYSYSTAPASPLLRSQPAPPAEFLPPLARPALHKPSPPRASDEVVAKIRELRATDPDKYSRGQLAKMFNVTRAFVSMIAPVNVKKRKEIRRKFAGEAQEARSKWSERHSLVMAIRKKRRELW